VTEKHYCIICGKEIQSDDSEVVICPEHSGPSQSKTLEKQPQETTWEAEQEDVQPLRDIAASWQPGQTLLDAYEVIGKLGEGGMGLVYLVHHKSWNMNLAVKQPKATLFATQKGKEDFIREAETWVNLGLHPHITSCYYVRVIDDIPHIFVEFMEGKSLEHWIQRKDYDLYAGGPEESLERVLDTAIQFAWGLAYAHEQGLVHQDVKPLNVLMTPDGVVKVTDFGLAKARAKAGESAEGKDTQALVSGSLHTVAYRSPEQAKGEMMSHKTDIWSWAVSVLEMFEGGVYWYDGQSAGTTLETYLKRRSEDDLPSMPEGLIGLLRQCFLVNPKDRPSDMLVIAQKLVEIYEKVTGVPYTHQIPDPAGLRADSLNNKALSFLDLEQHDEADKLFKEALNIDPFHSDAIFNQTLHHWRQAEIDDQEAIKRIKIHLDSLPDSQSKQYLLGLIHIERGDLNAAFNSMEGIETHPELQSLVDQLRPMLEQVSENQILPSDSRVVDVAFHPEGKIAASVSETSTLKIWDLISDECLQSFSDNDFGMVSSIAFHPDGKKIITGHHSSSFYGKEPSLHLWDLETETCINDFGGFDLEVTAIAVHPDGRRLLTTSSGAAFSQENVVNVWDLATGECLHSYYGHDRGITSLVISPSGSHAVTCGYDRSMGVLDLESGKFHRIDMDLHSINSPTAITPDGQFVLIAGSEGESDNDTIRLMDLRTEEWVREYKGHEAWVNAIDIHPDGNHFISGGAGRTLKLWNLSTGVCIRSINEGYDIHSGAFSPNGKQVLYGAYRSVFINLESSLTPTNIPYLLSTPITAEAATTAEQQIDEATQALQSGEFSKARGLIESARAVQGYERAPDGVDIWHRLYLHLDKGQFRDAWLERTFEGHEYWVKAAAFSPDGKYAISGGHERLAEKHTLRLWDVNTGECLNAFSGHDKRVNDIVVSPDGKSFLSASDDPTPRLWKIDENKSSRRVFKGHQGIIRSVCYSPDGRFILSGSADRTAKLWDIATQTCLRTFSDHEYRVDRAFFSPDGSSIFTLNGKELKRWEPASGQCLGMMEIEKDNRCLALHPEGNTLLTGDDDGMLHLYYLSTGERIWSIEAHRYWTNSVCFSMDGHFFASASNDGTLKLWEFSSKQCLHTFTLHDDNVTDVTFSPDGGSLLSASDDHTLKLWLMEWELEEYHQVDWDEGARPYLEKFLTLHTPYADKIPEDREPKEEEIQQFLTRKGKPAWNEKDFQALLTELGCRGYGWLQSEGVRQKLEELAEERG